MKKSVAEIRKELQDRPARSAWDNGVKEYALELFDRYVGINCMNNDTLVSKITETELRDEEWADNWLEYSVGGFSLISDRDICKRLCNPSTQRKLRYGECRPNRYRTWLTLQADALHEAARIIARTSSKGT